MPNGVVLLVCPVLHTFGKRWQCPYRLAARVGGFGHHPWLLCCLGVAQQVVKELRLHCPEESLLGRTEAWFCCWALMFAHAIERQQLLKVHTLKLWSTIDHDSCWQSPIAFDTQPKRHHTGSVTWGIKREVVGSDPSGMREDQQRQPAFS